MFPLRNSKLNDFFEHVDVSGEATGYDIAGNIQEKALFAAQPYL